MAQKNRRQRRLEQSRRARLVPMAGGVWTGGSNPGRLVAVAVAHG